MNQLEMIAEGSLLIQNGIIRQSGTSRRVDNLAQARKAREIDASGKIVMPAFVDPGSVLVLPRLPRSRRTAIQVLSKARLQANADRAAADLVRYGYLSVGADTRYAADMRDTVKILRVHNALQGKPLRIRSVFVPALPANASLKEKWLQLIRTRKLATIIELSACPETVRPDEFRDIAVAAAAHGYLIRIRARDRMAPHLAQLALDAGAIAIMSDPGMHSPKPGELSSAGCVHVLPTGDAFRDDNEERKAVRRMLDDGAALALCSGSLTDAERSYNPQYLLHMVQWRFGLTCEQAIVALTYNGACALRMSHMTGSLEPGKSADLVMMDVSDYRELTQRVGHSDVHAVMKAGRFVYKRASLIPD